MGIGEIGFKNSTVIGLGAFAQTDEAIAFPHLEADTSAFSFVAFASFIGFLVHVNGFDILFPAKGQVGIFCRVSPLCI